MNVIRKDKIDWVSVAAVALLHLAVVLVLYLVVLHNPERHAESGVPVVLGNMGNLDTDYDLTELVPFSAVVPNTVQPYDGMTEMVTQNMEETVSLDDGDRTGRQTAEVNKPTAEDLRAEAEKRAAAEANELMQNLFNGSRSSADVDAERTETDLGAVGSVEGNSNEGKITGIGGFGTFDLNGRDVGDNGLQRPAYTVQEEGRVVVTITVSPSGEVIATSINKRSNTTNAKLRAAAEAAARSTRFNAVDSPDNQTGTITYYFRLK